jgi:hypothetical protein
MNKTILYIIGAGRSGTTLLDVMLGNADNVFSGGEMNRYPITDGEVRGLEDQPERITFWRKFRETFSPRFDLDRQKEVHNEVEYHSGFVKQLLGRVDKVKYAEYQDFIRQFYELMFDSMDEDIIVDSSKYPGRALAMSEALPYRICYLYIKRDPIQVVKSFAKTDMFIPTKSWGSANLYYLSVNHLCKIALRKLRKKHPVHGIMYEDLVSKPEGTLQSIEKAFDIDLSAVIQKVARDEYLTVGDLFAGNTMRIKSQIKLRRGVSKNEKNLRNRMTRLINMTVYS